MTRQGINGFVLKTGTHWVYYKIHMNVSSLSRFKSCHHTLVKDVRNKRSSEVELEAQLKAYNEALTVSKRVSGCLEWHQRSSISAQRFYIHIYSKLNLFDLENPTSLEYKQRETPKTCTGWYEQWPTVPLCSETQWLRGLIIDVKKSFNRFTNG